MEHRQHLLDYHGVGLVSEQVQGSSWGSKEIIELGMYFAGSWSVYKPLSAKARATELHEKPGFYLRYVELKLNEVELRCICSRHLPCSAQGSF